MAKKFELRVIDKEDPAIVKRYLDDIGIDKGGMERLERKAIFRLILIKDLPVEPAHILKQLMLSLGADAAISRDAYVFSAKSTDVLLMGTIKQIALLCAKTAKMPFGLDALGEEIKKSLISYESGHKHLYLGKKRFELAERTLIAGILNVTPDSFSDGGLFLSEDKALSQAVKLAEDGADIIDIGGESSRPGAQPVSEAVELERVIPLIEKVTRMIDVPVSIDTYKAKVADEAVKAGATMVNDISGLSADPAMIDVLRRKDVAVVIMHMLGTPDNMQEDPVYDSLIGDISAFLRAQVDKCVATGVLKSQILIDPGIGFGKTLEHNLTILNRLDEFKSIGCPIYTGSSRKSFIGQLTGKAAGERLLGTAAAVAVSIMNGAAIVRVHDVAEMAEVVKVTDAIKRERA